MRSDFVRIVRNNFDDDDDVVVVPQMEYRRHVAFADEPRSTAAADGGNCNPNVTTMVMRPPLDYLTYAGKRWILDPTQFMEPVNAAASAASAAPCQTSASAFQREPPSSSSYQHNKSDRKSRAQRDLLSTLQARPSFVRQRFDDRDSAANDDDAAQLFDADRHPQRLNVYSKYETHPPIDDDDGDDDNAELKDALFERIVSKVARDKVIIEDILEPKIAEEASTVVEKVPSVLANFEDVLYGEKISDNVGDTKNVSSFANVPAIPTPVALQKVEADPHQSLQPIANTAVDQAAPIAIAAAIIQEDISPQPNEPVYADVDYSKQYEYQEYDASYDPVAQQPSTTTAEADSVVTENCAEPQLPYAPTTDEQNPTEILNTSDQYHQQPTVQYENNEPTTYDNNDATNQQPTAAMAGEYDQYAVDPGADQQQFVAQNYDIAADQQQNLEYASNNNDEAVAVDEYSPQQYPAQDGQQQSVYDQQQVAYDSQPDQQQQEQQQPQEQQQRYVDDPNYYAQGQTEQLATGYDGPQPGDAYDPNAEYQVAHDGDPQQQPQLQQEGVGAYYDEQQQQQQYYNETPQYDYNNPTNDGDVAQMQQGTLPAPAESEIAPVNYVTGGEADENSAAATSVAAADNSGTTGSDFDFSVK